MIELGAIQWTSEGLVPIIAQNRSGEVLMLAYANRQALEMTQETGFMHYWSRSRKMIWKKGESSGHTQRLISLHLDCDQDAVLARVDQVGPACHTNASTCFGELSDSVLQELAKIFVSREQNPQPGSYVNQLLDTPRRVRQKVGEEAVEVTLASTRAELISESADLAFHLLLLLHTEGISWNEILEELSRRRS